jgi:hypothetical protein
LKAVSFIPLLVRLSIEFGTFHEELRGGLLLEDEDGDNIVHCLTLCCNDDFQNYNEAENCEHHELVDDKYLAVMKKLIQMGLLKKEDIRRYGLLTTLCRQSIFGGKDISIFSRM